MFDYEHSLKILEKFSGMKEKKRIKFLKTLIRDPDFVSWLFCPKQVPNLAEMVNALYVIFTKPKVMRSLNDTIVDVGYDKFDRNQATFLYSICNIAIQSNNERIVEINKQKKEGSITNKEANDIFDKVEDYNNYIKALIKTIKKIVKSDAKKLAQDTHLSKQICITAYHSVPDFSFIDRFKVGYYLNNLLNDIYASVDLEGSFEENVKWKPFFKAIFGNDNIIEVATFILLEGVHRIDTYQSSKYVKECWDSLTKFALKELNEAPETLRGQMIELYIKRIDKMFSNKAFDLRVNLLSLSNKDFPKLVETITGYASKLEGILGRGR